VEVVSKAFEGKNPVQRHRMVYQLLEAEIAAGVHGEYAAAYLQMQQ
jgi:stress-induced morphogen